MARYVSDGNQVAFIQESGTYANSSGAGVWPGLVTAHEISSTLNVEPIRYEPEVKLTDYIEEKASIKPGITKELIQLQTDIKKNMDYVMGRDDKKEESKESVSNEDDKYKEDKFDR